MKLGTSGASIKVDAGRDTCPDEAEASDNQQSHQNIAIGLALVSVFVFSGNGELLQALQLSGGQVEISPIANLILCHSGGLLFVPYLIKNSPTLADSNVSRTYVFGASLLFALVLMGYNYAWIKSATFLPVALTNSICQTSVMFVYVASVAMFGEPLTWRRSVGVLCCLSGLMLASGFSPTLGISKVGVGMEAGAWLAALSALGVTLYQVLFRRMFCTCKSDVHFLIYFFACVSIVHIVIILPLALLASAMGLEEFKFPSTPGGITAAFISGAMASAVNMLYLCVMSWGRPMLMPCTNVLTIPTLVVLDILFHGIVPPAVEVIGHVLIVASIVLILDVRLNACSIVTYWVRKARADLDACFEEGQFKWAQIAQDTSSLSASLLNTGETP